MAESILYDTVGKLLGYLAQPAAQSATGEITSYFGGQKKLTELQRTMNLIRARLHDAETSQEGEHGETIKLLLKELKNVSYQLDDLLDEVSITSRPDEHMPTTKLRKLVCCLVEIFDDLKMSRKLNKGHEIMKNFEKIFSEMDKLGLREHHIGERPTFNPVNDREEGSFNLEEDVVGRDEDKNKIVQMLIGSDHGAENLCVIPIVGIGGLGKTALAQLVYNDPEVKQHFEPTCWACISDTSHLGDLKKLLKCVPNDGVDSQEWTREQFQSKLREELNDKRYLLVLDDVWDEDYGRWAELRRLLCGGKQGSKIIVTTRSDVVASNMGTVEPYELKSLAEDKSWDLFKAIAFREGQLEDNPAFDSIGREIVKKCANVPLAIRVIAGLLRPKNTIEEWIHLKDSEISKIDQKNDILSTLKISYNHLRPQLKECFGYCSLFPKDHEFDIKELIWAWISQGYIVTSDINQSLYDVGYGCFMELLRGCFFQEVKRDFLGNLSCKMHDLMQVLACEVIDRECRFYNEPMNNFDDNRHVHFYLERGFEWEFNVPQHIRSLFLSSVESINIDLIRRFIPSSVESINIDLNRRFIGGKGLRALCIDKYIKCEIPECIGELKHLRYLRIYVRGSYLSKGITKLQKLQTLELNGCVELRELPRDFSNLTSLRHLQIDRDVYGSRSLNEMPCRFKELSQLEMLSRFVVGDNNGLDALGSMSLIGELGVEYRTRRPNATTEAKNANMKHKKLSKLRLRWEYLDEEEGESEEEAEAEEVIKCLEPPSTLRELTIHGWKGVRLPRWGRVEFPNLVNICIAGCKRCKYLPVLSELPCLKELILDGLDALEYVEEGEGESGSGATATTTTSLSSSSSASCWNTLEELRLSYCPKLRMSVSPSSLPLLNELQIDNCPELEWWDDDDGTKSCDWCWHGMPNLRVLRIGINKLEVLPRGLTSLTTLEDLWIYHFPNLKALPHGIDHLTQLRRLIIQNCPKLRVFPDSIATLPTLNCLLVDGSEELARRYKKPDGEDWSLLQHIPTVSFDRWW